MTSSRLVQPRDHVAEFESRITIRSLCPCANSTFPVRFRSSLQLHLHGVVVTDTQRLGNKSHVKVRHACSPPRYDEATSRSCLFIAQPERCLEVERFGRASYDGVQHRLSVHHDPAEQTSPVVSVRRCKHTTLSCAGADLPVVGVVIAPPGCCVHVVVDQPVVGSRADANLLLLLPGEITSVRVKVPQNHNFLKKNNTAKTSGERL